MVKLQADTSTQGTQWGTGGMATKLTAARIAVAAGTTMVIHWHGFRSRVGFMIRHLSASISVAVLP